MQKDFHYFTIRILAEKAGFTPNEAQIIAYASQYVDDATEHKPIDLPINFLIDHPRIKGNQIDPTCTAHKGIQFLQDFKKQTQMQIYMCFHFLPAQTYTNQLKYSYITKADSPFSHLLLEKIKKQFFNNPTNRTYNLIALGIALHTYADTWAHQNFSGTHNHLDNFIDKIKYWQDGQWFALSKTGKLRKKILPSIGHAEAYNFPDLPYLNWKYEYVKNKTIIIKNNLSIFIDAAKKIFDFLKSFNEKHENWENFAGRLIQCFSFADDTLSKRCNFYSYHFPEIGFFYNKNLWKNLILKTEKYAKNLTLPIKKTAPETKWLLFHKAAFEQRKFVLKNIKKL
jgi:hypothetical protein